LAAANWRSPLLELELLEESAAGGVQRRTNWNWRNLLLDELVELEGAT
jgi:hypothetical protein